MIIWTHFGGFEVIRIERECFNYLHCGGWLVDDSGFPIQKLVQGDSMCFGKIEF